MKKIMLGMLMSLFLVSGVFASVGTFERNTTYDLADVGDTSVPAVFELDGNRQMIVTGWFGCGHLGYTWSGSGWVANSTIINGLTTVSSERFITAGKVDGIPTLMENNVNYDKNNITAYSWNGSSWVWNTTLESNLNNYVGTENNLAPELFYWDETGKWRIAVGYSLGGTGTLTIKEWTGSTWQDNQTYSSGEFQLSDRVIPSYLYFYNRHWILTGTYQTNGGHAHYWNGTNWVLDDSPFSELPFGSVLSDDISLNFENVTDSEGSKWLLMGRYKGNVQSYKYLCISNWTYSDYNICFNSTNNETTIVWTDQEACDVGNTTFNVTTYPVLTYDFSHLTTDCFNITRVNNWYWYNDTSSCGYYYNTTNTTDCLVTTCGDASCSASYQCSVGACVLDFNETQTTCCDDCGTPDPFTECKGGVLRDKPTERTLSDIGEGTGNLFTGMATPLMVFILLMALGTGLGYIMNSLGQSVGGKV